MEYFVGALLLAFLSLFIFCLIEIHKRTFKTRQEKALWLTFILFCSFVGIFMYIFFGKKKGYLKD